MLQRREELTALWENPQHWTGMGFYKCADDPRIWVPMPGRSIGWTINLAHWRGRLMLASTLGVAGLLMALAMTFGTGEVSPLRLVGVPVLALAVTIGVHAWLSRTAD